jgi:hypothetical protein
LFKSLCLDFKINYQGGWLLVYGFLMPLNATVALDWAKAIHKQLTTNPARNISLYRLNGKTGCLI